MTRGEEHPVSGRRTRRIVIGGNGLVAWLAAAALARALPAAERSIRILETNGGDELASPGHTDGTLPLTDSERHVLAGDEDAILRATGGTFALGRAFTGWSAQDSTWFHPFGSTGAGLGSVPFHHLALRLRREGRNLRFADYSLAALAAQAGRFSRPERDARSVLSTLRYGLQVDCAKLTEMLRATAGAAGVRRLDGTLRHAEPAEDGRIAALITDDGHRIEGDLFLDCSGPDAQLIGKALATEWLDWSAWLPCDRVIGAKLDAVAPPPPYSLARAHRGGWIRHLPLQSSTTLLGFYSGAAVAEHEALERLRHSAGGATLTDIGTGALRSGRRECAWRGNCVALGAAAAIIDPLAATNLQLALSGIDRLLRLLPGSANTKAVAAEYNRQSSAWLDHARDFAILYYKLNGRRGEALWDDCRGMSIPDTLACKLALYRSRGRVPMYDEEPYEESAWVGLFDGMGVEPRRYSQAADGFATAEIDAHCRRVREVMLDALRRMPSHADFLARGQFTDFAGNPAESGVVDEIGKLSPEFSSPRRV